MPGESGNHGGSLHVGPAGWSYKDWIGPVYPPGKRTDQLVTIASLFDCIELNSSFYRVPGEKLTRSWADRVSSMPSFRFTVKAWQRFTHERKCEADEIAYFISAFDPLLDTGRLGAFLFQFPWSFKNVPGNRRYLERIGKYFKAYPTAVELRHGSWNTPDILKLLSDHGLCFCNIDQPLIGDSIPPTDYSTSPRLGYIRLHGRNRKNWFNSGAGRDERYDYLYDEKELEEWSRKARNILDRVEHLFIITNNHFKGQALANAFQLRAQLEKQKLRIPDSLTSAFPDLRKISLGEASQGNLLDEM